VHIECAAEALTIVVRLKHSFMPRVGGLAGARSLTNSPANDGAEVANEARSEPESSKASEVNMEDLDAD
jgi:hypothetical protein